jgi:hypothetical protein
MLGAIAQPEASEGFFGNGICLWGLSRRPSARFSGGGLAGSMVFPGE